MEFQEKRKGAFSYSESTSHHEREKKKEEDGKKEGYAALFRWNAPVYTLMQTGEL